MEKGGNMKNPHMMEDGGVIGQEIVFDDNGEENKGVIKDIHEITGNYIVSTDDGRTVLADKERDVISLGKIRKQAESKKRFSFFEQGGNLDSMSLNQLLDKVPVFERMHIDGYSNYARSKEAFDDLVKEFGNKRYSEEESRQYDNFKKRKIMYENSYKQNVIKYLHSRKMEDGGKIDEYKGTITDDSAKYILKDLGYNFEHQHDDITGLRFFGSLKDLKNAQKDLLKYDIKSQIHGEGTTGFKELRIPNQFVLMKDGGNIEKENNEMLHSQAKEAKHHIEELHNILTSKTKVEPWVVAKMTRAKTDLSDITHYLDGNTSKMAQGGGVDIVKKDRYGNEVKIGDAIHIRVLTGSYGQTKDYEGIVTNFDKFGNVELDGQKNLSYTADYTHNDYEHGHHIWVEKINPKDIKENLRVPKKYVPSYSGTINGEKFGISGKENFLKWVDKNYPNSIFDSWYNLRRKGWNYENDEYVSPEKEAYEEIRVYESAEKGQGFLYSLMIPKGTSKKLVKPKKDLLKEGDILWNDENRKIIVNGVNSDSYSMNTVTGRGLGWGYGQSFDKKLVEQKLKSKEWTKKPKYKSGDVRILPEKVKEEVTRTYLFDKSKKLEKFESQRQNGEKVEAVRYKEIYPIEYYDSLKNYIDTLGIFAKSGKMAKGGTLTSAQQNKFDKVMHEWKAGELHSGKNGPIVTNQDQAIAIAYSEAYGMDKMLFGGMVNELSDDTIDRMEGLVPISTLQELLDNAKFIIADMYEEGFEKDEIMSFLAYKISQIGGGNMMQSVSKVESWTMKDEDALDGWISDIQDGYGWITPGYVESSWTSRPGSGTKEWNGDIQERVYQRLIDENMLFAENPNDYEKKGKKIKSVTTAIWTASEENGYEHGGKMKTGGNIKKGDVYQWHTVEYDSKKGNNYKVVKQVEITDIYNGDVIGRVVGTSNEFIIREPNKYLKKKVSSKMATGGGIEDIKNELSTYRVKTKKELLDFYKNAKVFKLPEILNGIYDKKIIDIVEPENYKSILKKLKYGGDIKVFNKKLNRYVPIIKEYYINDADEYVLETPTGHWKLNERYKSKMATGGKMSGWKHKSN